MPASLAVGWKVRNCNWAGEASGSGVEAKDVLKACFLMLLQLTSGESHVVEYVRTLGCALLVWRGWNSSIPAGSYSDECNESSLAQLGGVWADHPEISTAEQLMDAFLLQPPPPSDPHDLPAKSCSRHLADTVALRVRVLAGHADPAMPYAPWLPKAKKTTVRSAWPSDPWFPPSVRVPPDPAYLSDLLQYHTTRLIQQPPLTAAVLSALDAHNIPLRPPADAHHLRTTARSLCSIPSRFATRTPRRHAQETAGLVAEAMPSDDESEGEL